MGLFALGETTTANISSGVSDALVSGLSSVATDMGSFITNILPVVLGVVGAVILISFGIKLFKRFSKG
jgi:hypothetical protein